MEDDFFMWAVNAELGKLLEPKNSQWNRSLCDESGLESFPKLVPIF